MHGVRPSRPVPRDSPSPKAEHRIPAEAPGWLVAPAVMGVVNVTPDSFSDGGEHLAVPAAVATIRRMADEGAAIVDVGAESTRPGADRVPPGEQLRRLAPLLDACADMAPGVPLSIDTTSMPVAEAALEAGVRMVNDISAGREDPGMFDLVAGRGVDLCLMHMRGQPRDMQDHPRYDDVVDDVRAFLEERMRAATSAGVDERRIVLDPGIGFGKTLDHNLALIAGIGRLTGLGRPILVGASRKGMVGLLTQRPVEGRLAGSIGAALAAVDGGAAAVRVHDVAETVDALRVWAAIRSKLDG